MKKLVIVLTLVGMLAGLGAAESRIRFGFLAPKDADTSFMGGFTHGQRIDEAVSFDMSMDIYYKGFTEKRNVGGGSSGGTDYTSVVKSTDIKTTYIPLMMNLYAHLPIKIAVSPYVSGGIGWGLLWEDDFVAGSVDPHGNETEAIDDVYFYNGFVWNVAAGVSYKLGSRSNVFAELFYHGSKMKRNVEETAYGVVWDEVDMSGIGMRLGIAFGYNLN